MRRHEPKSLYEPIRYILRAGGKRVRPVLTLLACEAVGGRAARALNAAVAVEVLHSFTLVHDDIMDNAETRRGVQTVHKKWDHNTAILAGDQMVALAYQSLLKTPQPIPTLVKAFTKAFHEVCEGQGFDEAFEHRRDVGMGDYMQMIKKKTAAMISAAAALGGIVGGGTKKEITALQRYGEHLGRAFQIQDDLLDVVAKTSAFGKKVGSDLKEGKKTFLLLEGIERARGKERAFLQGIVRRRVLRDGELQRVKGIFEREGILADASRMVRSSTRRAQRALRILRPSRARDMLIWFADELVERKQ